jgi:mono/diheme cytochrome c family protein
MGCSACHNPNAPENADTPHIVGPNLGDLYVHAGTMVPGQDAETYVHTSIVDPGAFTVPGYEALATVMPRDFATRMTPEEIDGLVKWLLDPNRVKQ